LTILKNKILTISLVFVVMATLLEIRLRTSSVTDFKNINAVGEDDTIRILALGDSITRGVKGGGDYTIALEKLLNQAGLCKKVKVSNFGMPGAETFDLVRQIDGFLRDQKPHVVITMIGGGDRNFWPEENWRFKAREIIRKLRIVRLFSIAWAKISRGGFSFEEERKGFAEAIVEPKYDETFDEFFKTGLDNGDYTHLFGVHLRNARKYEEALRYHRRMLDKYPQHENAWIEIGFIYLEQAKLKDAEASFLKAIELSKNPSKTNLGYSWGYFGLGELYEKYLQQPESAEIQYLKAMEVNPSWHFPYIFLSSLYKKLGWSAKREKILLQGIEKCPDNPRIYENLADLYEETENLAASRRYADIAEKLWFESRAWEYTSRHYQMLNQIIRDHGAFHVAMQYPMRPIQPLITIMGNSRKTFFVSNESEFKERVSKEGYQLYFFDNFVGLFGHLTHKAADLIASSVASFLLPKLDQEFCRKNR